MADASFPPSGQPPNMHQSEHERMRMRWEERMKFPGQAIRYDKTSVLLLSWDSKHSDLGTGDEVNALKNVFKNLYGFKVRDERFNTERKPQHQAGAHLSDFVLNEDDERGLIIIYYAGHGYSDATSKVGDLKWAGRLPPPTAREAAERQENRNSIVWSEIAPAIKRTDAAVLLIFDCCNAGSLCRPDGRALPQSFYQILGACAQGETTCGPGPKSFTSALIWALEQLAEKEIPFNTSELRHKIIEYDYFPAKQIPVLTDVRYGEHIAISRKDLKPNIGKQAPSKSEQLEELLHREYVDLRFHFDDKVTDQSMDDTANALRLLMDKKTAFWYRVTFQGKHSMRAKVEHAVAAMRRNANVSKSVHDVSPIDHSGPFLVTQSPSIQTSQLSPAMPTIPYTPGPSNRASRTSSVYEVASAGEHTPLLLQRRRTGSRQRYVDDVSIAVHLWAIWRKLLAIPSYALAWLAHRLNP